MSVASTSFATLSLPAVLEDLARSAYGHSPRLTSLSRFIVNLPPEEQTLQRICWQVEQSHWFYEDFVRPQNARLPSFSLRKFAELILSAATPYLDKSARIDPRTAFETFQRYKLTVPVCGAIILNTTRDKVLLVKGWKAGSSWSFPRGKINQGERDRDCAVREVWEEVGYDIRPHFDASLAPHPAHLPGAPPSMPVDPDDVDDELSDDFLEISSKDGQRQRMRLYIVIDVEEQTSFETRTRREISVRLERSHTDRAQKIAWFALRDLPATHASHARGSRSGGEGDGHSGKFFMVAPFIRPLKAWIKRHRQSNGHHVEIAADEPEDENSGYRAFSSTDESSRALQAFFLGAASEETTHNSVHEPVRFAPPTPTPSPPEQITQQALPPLPSPDTHDLERQRAEVLANLASLGVQDPSPAPSPTTQLPPGLAALFESSRPVHAPPQQSSQSSPARQRAAAELLSTLKQGPQRAMDPHLGHVAAPPPMPAQGYHFPPAGHSQQHHLAMNGHPQQQRAYAQPLLRPMPAAPFPPTLQPVAVRPIALLNYPSPPPRQVNASIPMAPAAVPHASSLLDLLTARPM